MYSQACVACGEYSLDFTDLHFAYEQKRWPFPSCTIKPGASVAAPALAGGRGATSGTPASAVGFSTALLLMSISLAFGDSFR